MGGGRQWRLLAGVTTPASAAAVSAACQSRTGPDQDFNPYGYHFTESVHLRSGPSRECGVVGFASVGNKVDYHCWRWGDDDSGYWTYLRTRNTVYGWVWEGYLEYGGTTFSCA
ncbi:SH3 domain-containing protein [Micromonospora sp. NPDC085948]|uniref:SH3 domain-containing protein n=1 Tax=Micromonospora sp. NPDC085948 TaxID=3155293 RepID=UPI0034268C1E